MSTLLFLEDKNYSIVTIVDSTWLRVEHKGELVALVMNIETARQVIYREIISKKGECSFLHEDDFVEK